EQRGSAGVQDKEFVIIGNGQHVLHRLVMGCGVHELAPRHQCGRLRQPRGEPVGSDLTLGLVARARAAVKAVVGRGTEEQRLLHLLSPNASILTPSPSRTGKPSSRTV